MFFHEGMQCPVCGRLFSEEDDIVSCPQCGLSHHRHCWQKEGHCHMADLHGTEQQWDKARTAPSQSVADNSAPDAVQNICSRCQAPNPEYAEFCQRCGTPLTQKEWHSQQKPWYASTYHEYTPFLSGQEDNYGYTDEVDGASTEHLAAIVGPKTNYYIPRFRQISRTGSGGWNWAAFLLGPYWFLYRRMYLGGSLLLIMNTVYSLLANFAMLRLGITNPYIDMVDIAQLDSAQKFYLLSIFLLTGIMTVVRVIVAALSNRFYKQHCVSVVKKTRERVPDISASELTRLGGTSYSVAAIGYTVSYVVLQLLAVFLF